MSKEEREKLHEEFYCKALESFGVPKKFVNDVAVQSVQIAVNFADARNQKAMDLLDRVMPMLESNAPDKTWFADYFALTGEHAILTDDGWHVSPDRAAFDPDEILAEVNAPERCEATS